MSYKSWGREDTTKVEDKPIDQQLMHYHNKLAWAYAERMHACVSKKIPYEDEAFIKTQIDDLKQKLKDLENERKDLGY